MSSKSTSPEAAQRKVWKQEIAQLEKNGNKVKRDFRKEFKKSQAVADAAKRASLTAHAKHLKLAEKLAKNEDSILQKINSRIAQLRGRLGF